MRDEGRHKLSLRIRIPSDAGTVAICQTMFGRGTMFKMFLFLALEISVIVFVGSVLVVGTWALVARNGALWRARWRGA